MTIRLQALLVSLSLLVFLPTVAQRQYPTGLTFDDERYMASRVSAALKRSDYSEIPKSFSLLPYTPTPGDQGQTGTCTAWSIAYHARTILESIEMDRTSRTETNKNTFSPSYVYNQIRFDNGCENGTVISDALKLLVEEGVAKYSQFGFSCGKPVYDSDRAHAERYKIYDFKRLHSTGASNKILPVKKSISEKKPVVFGMVVPNSFFRARSVWEPGKLEYTNAHAGGHAMCVVGYDDNKYGGAFLVINSWGTGWGENGFTWIRYSDYNVFTKYSYELIPTPKPQVMLSGSLRFELDNGTAMDAAFDSGKGMYRMKDDYRSGQQFQFTLSNNEPAYVYAFGYDKTGEVFKLFPFEDSISPYLGYKKANVVFPDEEHYVRFDQTEGTDVFCFLYSNKKIDLNDLVTRFKQTGGASAWSRLKSVLGEDLLPPDHVKYGGGNIQFTASCTRYGIVPVIIEMNHQPASEN